MRKPPNTRLCLAIIAGVFRSVCEALAQEPSATPASDSSVAPSTIAVESPTSQTTEETGLTAETERIIVTGSYIPTAEEVGPNPVLEINRDLIEKSGERTTAELLRKLPIAGPQGVPTSNNGNTPIAGASSISLRGFDPSDTLTLIDGLRVAPYPVGAGNNSTQTFVDLNSIPRAAIESIEILKDGASSTYGADAVAGVVNIKLRRDYRGVETSVNYGNTLDKDSSEFSASLLFGAGDSNTLVTGVLNFYHRNSIYNRDRGYSAVARSLSTNSSPANLQLSSDAVLAAGVSPAQLPEGDTFFGQAPVSTNGNAPASDYTYTRRRSSFYNFNSSSVSLPDSERYGGFVNAEHKIFGEQMVLVANMFYQNVQTRYQLAPVPTGDFESPGLTTLAIPPRAPGATVGGPSYEETGVPMGAFNPFNPFQQIISGGTRARLVEFGNRNVNNETDAYFSTIGLKGDKLFDGSWGYAAFFRYSQIKNTATGNSVSSSRFDRILNAADPIFNPASTAGHRHDRPLQSVRRFSAADRDQLFASCIRHCLSNGDRFVKARHARSQYLHHLTFQTAGGRIWSGLRRAVQARNPDPGAGSTPGVRRHSWRRDRFLHECGQEDLCVLRRRIPPSFQSNF